MYVWCCQYLPRCVRGGAAVAQLLDLRAVGRGAGLRKFHSLVVLSRMFYLLVP